MLFIQGLPIFYLELAIGQRLRKGAIGVWNEVSPYLGGIGLSSAIVSFMVALYYNTIIGWCLIYLFHSVENPLPWSNCPVHLLPNMTCEFLFLSIISAKIYKIPLNYSTIFRFLRKGMQRKNIFVMSRNFSRLKRKLFHLGIITNSVLLVSTNTSIIT